MQLLPKGPLVSIISIMALQGCMFTQPSISELALSQDASEILKDEIVDDPYNIHKKTQKGNNQNIKNKILTLELNITQLITMR